MPSKSKDELVYNSDVQLIRNLNELDELTSMLKKEMDRLNNEQEGIVGISSMKTVSRHTSNMSEKEKIINEQFQSLTTKNPFQTMDSNYIFEEDERINNLQMPDFGNKEPTEITF